MKRWKLYLALSLIMCIIVVEPVWATTISDIKKDQKNTQKELDKVNDKISDLKEGQSEVQEEINELDDSLVEILASISMIEEDLEKKQAELEVAQADYDDALAKEEEQYEAMKVRIKFMYEKGDTAYLEWMMKAQSFSEMVNKADYIEKLYEYDRNLLMEYEATREEVELLKEELETEKAELEATQHEYEEEKEALDTTLAAKKADAKNFEVQLAKAKQDAAAYKLKIEQQTAKIRQLEAEEARKNKKPSNGVTRVDPSIITNATGSALGKEIATYAIQFVGNPYVPGGTSLTNGADCSGFTYSVYKAYGYKIPRNSYSQRSAGKEVAYSQAEPGDLICYAGHVGMYIGGGKIVHASSVKTGIKVSNATYRTILSVRRIV